MFTFNKYTDEELNQLIPHRTVCDFQVLQAIERPSEKQKIPMVELVLKVWAPDGLTYTVKDFLMASKNVHFRLKHFCKAINFMDKYEQQGFEAYELTDKTGKALIGIRKGTDGYPDKNCVIDYLPPEPGKEKEFNDDIPFM